MKLSKLERDAIRRAVQRGYLSIGPNGYVTFYTDGELEQETGFILGVEKSMSRLMRDFERTFCEPEDAHAEKNALQLSELFLEQAYRLRRLARRRARERGQC